MDAYVARQPIFNKKRKIFAYELLFRDGTANYVPNIDGDTATTTLLSNTFFAIGMDTLCGGKKSFINFTQNLLIKKIPLLLPKDRIVIEILENVQPTEEIISACREMAKIGYFFALDDFEYRSDLKPLISLANIIKFDFLATPADKIRSYLGLLNGKKVVLLAEKVETYEDFEAAQAMGFELFQGYFFCKPEVIHGKQLAGNQLTMLQIMVESNKPEMDYAKIEAIVSRDMGMSYQLLRYINSAFFAKAQKISSIKQAVVYLGEKEIRRFMSLVAMSKLAEGKPGELLRTACVRAKFCELLTTGTKKEIDGAELFTLGLFSLIDAVIDQSMESIIKKLPLSENIHAALLRKTGALEYYLELAVAYEKGDWTNVSKYAQALEVEEAALPPLYMQACEWANRISNP